MKQLLAVAVFSLFVSDAFADDWRMRKFDLNGDLLISKGELIQSGCVKVSALFRHADRNADGFLNRREAQRASTLIFKNRCPRNPLPIVGVRG